MCRFLSSGLGNNPHLVEDRWALHKLLELLDCVKGFYMTQADMSGNFLLSYRVALDTRVVIKIENMRVQVVRGRLGSVVQQGENVALSWVM